MCVNAHPIAYAAASGAAAASTTVGLADSGDSLGIGNERFRPCPLGLRRLFSPPGKPLGVLGRFHGL